MLNAAGLVLCACVDVASLDRQIPEVDRFALVDHIKFTVFRSDDDTVRPNLVIVRYVILTPQTEDDDP